MDTPLICCLFVMLFSLGTIITSWRRKCSIDAHQIRFSSSLSLSVNSSRVGEKKYGPADLVPRNIGEGEKPQLTGEVKTFAERKCDCTELSPVAEQIGAYFFFRCTKQRIAFDEGHQASVVAGVSVSPPGAAPLLCVVVKQFQDHRAQPHVMEHEVRVLERFQWHRLVWTQAAHEGGAGDRRDRLVKLLEKDFGRGWLLEPKEGISLHTFWSLNMVTMKGQHRTAARFFLEAIRETLLALQQLNIFAIHGGLNPRNIVFDFDYWFGNLRGLTVAANKLERFRQRPHLKLIDFGRARLQSEMNAEQFLREQKRDIRQLIRLFHNFFNVRINGVLWTPVDFLNRAVRDLSGVPEVERSEAARLLTLLNRRDEADRNVNTLPTTENTLKFLNGETAELLLP